MAFSTPNKGNGMADEMKITDGVVTATSNDSFSSRLKAKIETLEVGKAIELTTVQDRQIVTNVVTQLKKKQGMNLSTRVLTGRDVSGKYTIQISKGAPATPVAQVA